MAFWDASALVPACVPQETTSHAVALYEVYSVSVWWGTSVEIASALARLRRMKTLDNRRYAAGTQRAKLLAKAWTEIRPSDTLRSNAEILVDRYQLRAADSLQLAVALAWCSNAPIGRIFLTADRKLHEAALLSGFDSQFLA
jgi:predicted nucleic acid-binding protein